MTVQLSAALEQELQHLAVERGLSTNDLAQRAIESFVVHQRDLDASIERGNADVASGRLLEHDDVVARIARLLTPQ